MMEKSSDKTHELFIKLCQSFPDVPTGEVQYYVNKHSNNEQACIDILMHKSQFYRTTAAQLQFNTLQNQFQQISLENSYHNDTVNAQTNATPVESLPKSSRSISDAGLPHSPRLSSSPASRAQTAPTHSDNYHGFNYPYGVWHQLPGNPVNNNNQYLPISTATSIPEEMLSNNVTKAPNIPQENSITPRRSPESSKGPELPPRPTMLYPSFQLPTSRGYIFVPSSSLSPSVSPNNTLSRDPRSKSPYLANNSPNSRSRSPHLGNMSPHLHNKSPHPRNGSPVPRNGSWPDDFDTRATEFTSELHIDIDSRNGNEWCPAQGFSPSGNYPVMQQPFYVVSPGFTATPMSLNQRHNMSPNFPMWNYPVQFNPPYFSPPSPRHQLYATVDFHSHLNQQRLVQNSLRYELAQMKMEQIQLKADAELLEEEILSNANLPNQNEIEILKTENKLLRDQCQQMVLNVDMHFKGDARLGEINEDFFASINTGQEVPPSPTRLSSRQCNESPHNPKLTGRLLSEDEENEEGSKWICVKCTFRNHPAISVCEMCQSHRK